MRPGRPTDVRVLEADVGFSAEQARTPIKFGNVVMNDATLCTVRVRVENRRGDIADGCGAIFLADFWAFPSANVPHEQRDELMRDIARRYVAHVRERFGGTNTFRHPIDIWCETQESLRQLSARAASSQCIPGGVPWLASLVSASPLDAALHDAFGRAAGIPSYLGYGAEHLSRDLGEYLAPLAVAGSKQFRGIYPADILRPRPVERLPIFHLVGGLDKLTRAEVSDDDPRDGLPRCLEEWIVRDGVYCLKVKLTGHDVRWDVERTVAVAEVARAAHAAHAHRSNGGVGARGICLTADLNEQSPDVATAVEYLHRLRERDGAAFDALLYLEQPTSRNLEDDPVDVRPIAALKPVIGDECVADLPSAERALALGWSGFALKTCKGQSFCVLALARAAVAGIPYAVQDLTNPGLALLQSVGLAAWSSPIKGVEYNSRQFFPWVSPEVRVAHLDVVEVRDGQIGTASLMQPGLGYHMDLAAAVPDRTLVPAGRA